MDRKFTVRVAAITIVSAIAIGAVMQSWPPVDGDIAEQPMIVSDVQTVSSAPRTAIPMDVPVQVALPDAVVSAASAQIDMPSIGIPATPQGGGFACDVDMTATPIAGAMMNVALNAPCHGSERVTFHHSGLMFTETMQPDGTLSVDMPALTEDALVIASFLDGTGGVATTQVTSVPFYDRVILQWRGNAGLQLHAREFDADYFTEGHIWQGAASDPTRAATGTGGFLTKLGAVDAPESLFAEVYTFPTGMTDRSGTVALTVETEILASNCDTSVEAQTLELRNGNALMSRELTVDVPGCDAVGDFLLLKNLVEDLTIAAK
ncbi:MAG: translocase [Marivita sp.]|uniref:translocase n=1 Tax=Marivita sp. TaxID=2003365 RepID=UPI003EFA4569